MNEAISEQDAAVDEMRDQLVLAMQRSNLREASTDEFARAQADWLELGGAVVGHVDTVARKIAERFWLLDVSKHGIRVSPPDHYQWQHIDLRGWCVAITGSRRDGTLAKGHIASLEGSRVGAFGFGFARSSMHANEVTQTASVGPTGRRWWEFWK
jgi:hypothetical protein